MAISQEKYDAIKSSPYSPHASWTVWQAIEEYEKPKARMGDLSVFKDSPKLLQTLHTDIVFVALNSADRDIQPKPFSAFHDTSPYAMDYKMRYAFKDTVLWGAYLTDFFHGLRETDSSKVKVFLATHPDFLRQSIARFNEEMRFIAEDGKKPTLIALGSQVKELLELYVASEYHILELPHYSYSVMTKERYRERALELIKQL